MLGSKVGFTLMIYFCSGLQIIQYSAKQILVGANPKFPNLDIIFIFLTDSSIPHIALNMLAVILLKQSVSAYYNW